MNKGAAGAADQGIDQGIAVVPPPRGEAPETLPLEVLPLEVLPLESSVPEALPPKTLPPKALQFGILPSGTLARGTLAPERAVPERAVPERAVPERAAPGTSASPTLPAALPVFPAPSAGLDVLGEFTGSGLTDRAFLVRRGDGQVIQLTTLLYLVLTAADGRRSVPGIAVEVTNAYGRRVSPANVAHLLERRLLPLGLIDAAGVPTEVVGRSTHLLALAGRRTLVPAPAVFAVAGLFAPLFHRFVVIAVLAALVVGDVWLAASVDVVASAATVLSKPAMLLAVLGIAFASFVFHEFGHATACRYGGARPGVIGMGVYLVWPALYTDVTDAYRLSRAGRLRTDLGGVYFNAVSLLGLIALWAATGSDLLVVAAFVIHLEALQQFVPVVRLDGYYILSDLAGVPDLFGRLGPVLADTAANARAGCRRAFRRHRQPAAKADSGIRVAGLTRRARIIISAWIVVVVPLLAANLVALLLHAPRLVATAVRSCLHAVQVAADAFGSGEALTGTAAALSVAISALTVAAVPFLVVRLALFGLRAARAACHARPARAVGFTLATALFAAALATYWVWRGI